jgi:hypothetical protein
VVHLTHPAQVSRFDPALGGTDLSRLARASLSFSRGLLLGQGPRPRLRVSEVKSFFGPDGPSRD